jgi:hypothetical protein
LLRACMLVALPSGNGRLAMGLYATHLNVSRKAVWVGEAKFYLSVQGVDMV